jgi:molybdenum cofactor cytidylyltransferase
MISAIILAAGQSRRMGAQKLLLPVSGRPMITRITDEVLKSSVDRTVVVIGTDPRIAHALAGRPLTLVMNPDPASEMLASIRLGLRAIPAPCSAIILVLGDQPGLSATTIDALIAASQPASPGIIVPTCAGRRGHPLLFSARYRDQILTEFDATGLRGLLHAHPDDIMELPLDEPAILEDIDLPEDYQRLAGR